jgi:hypothetical protein
MLHPASITANRSSKHTFSFIFLLFNHLTLQNYELFQELPNIWDNLHHSVTNGIACETSLSTQASLHSLNHSLACTSAFVLAAGGIEAIDEGEKDFVGVIIIAAIRAASFIVFISFII